MEDSKPEDDADLDVEPELLWSEQQQRSIHRARRLVHGAGYAARLAAFGTASVSTADRKRAASQCAGAARKCSAVWVTI